MPRLDRLVARSLGASRREVMRHFRAGRVRAVDGIRLDPRLNIPPAALPLTIAVNDQPLTLRVRFELVLNKPLGVVTAHDDRRHPTAYALLKRAPLFAELRAVGRLDKETSGLLMWTTDGTLLHRITHPRYAVERTYHVALDRPYRDLPTRLSLSDGYEPNIVELTRRDPDALHPALHLPPAATCFASVTITAGRFHEVRRIFAALGSHVVGLARVRFGPISLQADLAPGAFVATDLKEAFKGLHPQQNRPRPERTIAPQGVPAPDDGPS